MSVTLGSAFPSQRPEPDPVPDVRLELILAALESLREGLNSLPTPQVTLDAPDLSAIVNAVNGLRPGVVDPREIGEAVANALIPMRPEAASSDWQDRLIAALDKLDFRMKGLGGKGGGGPASLPPTLSTAPASDTGQTALPVRIISQLGAGSAGSGLTNTELRATPVPVSGTVSTGLTQPLTDTQLRATPVPVSGTVSTGGLTDTQIRATPLPISGTVSTGLTQPLTDTQMRATPVPVSGTVATGGLTDTQLRATPVPVSGTVSTGLTQPLTDAQIRATPLPVSGTVSTGLTQPLTDAQLRATAVPVSLATNTPTLAAGTNTVGNLNEIRAATTYATIVSSAVSLGATLTLAAPGAGLFHYITSIEITNYTGIARTGAATPITVTTTNITGSPAYTFATAAAIGTTDIQRPILATPLKVAAANTATTIVAPVVTGSFWRINVTYFVGA